MPQYQYLEYKTRDFKRLVVQLLSNGLTGTAVDLLLKTLPDSNPMYNRVVMISNQYRTLEMNEIEGTLGAFGNERRNRINKAILSLMSEFEIHYPDVIPLKSIPYLRQNLSPAYTYVPPSTSSKKAQKNGSSTGFGFLLGLILVVGAAFFFVGISGEKGGIKNPDSKPRAVADLEESIYVRFPGLRGWRGWILLLKEEADCGELKRKYGYTSVHHNTEIVRSSEGCALVIKFSSLSDAKHKKKKSSSLKRVFRSVSIIEI